MNQEETKNWTNGFVPLGKDKVPAKKRKTAEEIFATIPEVAGIETQWSYSLNTDVYVARRGHKILPFLPQ